ncbi:MAG TPA: tryptophan--tRNA ligase [Vicinamibacteria bacterium]|nr:tryptophan--tRNA ligase [Vicinamibacteria bacterium]
MKRPRILSGMRPTGPLHLGNYMGALDNWASLQDRYECFFSVVDWHSLTTDYANPGDVRGNVIEVATDWLAAGLDPVRSTLFIQSLVPQHAELHLLLSMIVPVPWLERVPTYKEQQHNLAEKDLSTYGFLGYPLLQTADIIVYKANAVPVGEDQVPHIELAREIVRRFNNLYGEVFPEPQTLLTEAKRIPGTDGRKMSKSYGNAIYLKDDPETLKQKLRPMLTDPARKRRTDPGDPGLCPVFDLHRAFSPQATREWAANGCRTAGIGCLDCKAKLSEHMLEKLAVVHARRPELAARPDTVWDILIEGSERARAVAEATLDEVRQAMKVRYERP